MFIERSRLRDIADKITGWLSPDGFECIDTDWDAQSRTLRVFVDNPTKGVALDDCALVSHKLVEIEELDQLIACEFNLEVSSPGIERPLRTLEHFKAAFGENSDVEIKLIEKHQNSRNGVGKITSISESGEITLKTTEGVWTFPVNSVQRAVKLADWEKVKLLNQDSASEIM